jgi:hypothetical protein
MCKATKAPDANARLIALLPHPQGGFTAVDEQGGLHHVTAASGYRSR